MLSLQILAAATCPTGQTAAPPNISSSCVWSTERTPSAFDCPALCAADMPADRERLLAVIESAFGDFRFFNKIVRREFAAANERLEQKSEKNLLSAERLPAVTV